jgi:hypothetical protein
VRLQLKDFNREYFSLTKDDQIEILRDKINNAFFTGQLWLIPIYKLRILNLQGAKRLEKDPYDILERLFDGKGREDE